MNITLDSEPLALVAPPNLIERLQAQGLAARRATVEINDEIVPRSQRAGQTLAGGDKVENVHALGGGRSHTLPVR